MFRNDLGANPPSVEEIMSFLHGSRIQIQTLKIIKVQKM